ncbi:hypothetical protein JMF94_04885 [Desulfovibrio sp. UIB00]|uniref:hypothetical protein n=1 Tax=Desulfovibrio sp. UIB00 TaxID=2804314 RepID=UPI001F0D221A|nr:hypothetical protein [Desulfovibrio sp. UIB00]MCH5144416.1 hypothetical protein [Desulfovibrio sp. UIB00]
MSAFPNDITNLSAVLDSLHSGECAIQQPILRFVIEHIRLLSCQMDKEISTQFSICPQTPSSTPESPAIGISARVCQTVETRHDQ